MRTIDADELLKSAGIFEAKVTARGCGKSILPLAKTWLWSEVNKAPTIDAVPVVRCKNCKYGEMFCNNDDNWIRCNKHPHGMIMERDFFCAYGASAAWNREGK